MPVSRPLRLYGQSSNKSTLEWAWVEDQLVAAGTYWVTARTPGHPHPRPVWGIWFEGRLYLSIGTPLTARALATDPRVSVHLDSGTDVVIVEGRAERVASDAEVLTRYDRKYDWTYDASEYGPLTCVAPQTVLAWRTAGWAGRESFQVTGCWRFE
jgi:Pyridoxamine 5'-phosphate oxidase